MRYNGVSARAFSEQMDLKLCTTELQAMRKRVTNMTGYLITVMATGVTITKPHLHA